MSTTIVVHGKTISRGLIPDAVAVRISGNEGKAYESIRAFHYTGLIQPYLWRELERQPLPELDSRGRRDDHAARAERNALLHYLETKGPRPAAVYWWTFGTGPRWREDHELVVAWGWTAELTEAKET